MNSINKKLVLLGLFFFSLTWIAHAQLLEDQLRAALDGKDKLEDIMHTVEDFYAPLSDDAKNGKAGIPKLKFWMRWAHYWSSRLGPEGEFVNTNRLLYEATNDRINRRGGKRWVPGDWEFVGATESTFTPINGPLNGIGRVDRIAFHPTDADIVYVGAPAGGVWKTTDGGATWTAMTDYLGSLGIAGIVVDAVSPNTVYILTGDGDSSNPNYFVSIFGYIRKSIGVLKSTDGGATWSSVGAFPGVPDPYYGYDLAQKPGSPNTLYAATTDGLFKTTDGGANWVLARAGRTWDVEFNTTGTQLYCADDVGFYRSTNQTTNTWAAPTYAPGGPLANDRKAIAVSPANTSLVYMMAGGNTGAGSFAGMFRSTDNGVNMTRMATTPNILGFNGVSSGGQFGYDHCMAVSPTNTALVVTGGLTIWRSTNSGSTYTNIHPYWGNPAPAFSVHPDIHALAFNPLDGKLYTCHDGGVNVSSDNGTTFTDLSDGIETTQAYHMAAARNKEYVLALGAQDNGVKYRPIANADFQHVTSGDGFCPSFVAGSDEEFYMSINDVERRFHMGTNSVSGINAPGGFYKVLEAHPTDPDIVFCGAASIYKSTNKGATWVNKGGSGFWSVVFAPSDPTVMYAAGNSSFVPSSSGKIWGSTDSGETWTDLTSNPGFPSGFTKITDLMVRPTNPNEVWAVFGGFNASQKVFFSTDGGANWSTFLWGLPNIPVNCIAWAEPNHVFIGTDIGVFHKLNNVAGNWEDVSDNMPNVPVTELLIDDDTGTLYAATFGRGVWEFPFCVANMNITEKLEGQLEYSASNTMTSTSEIPGDPENQILLNGANKTTLMPGFHAKSGSKVQVKNGTCTDNPLPN